MKKILTSNHAEDNESSHLLSEENSDKAECFSAQGRIIAIILSDCSDCS